MGGEADILSKVGRTFCPPFAALGYSLLFRMDSIVAMRKLFGRTGGRDARGTFAAVHSFNSGIDVKEEVKNNAEL